MRTFKRKLCIAFLILCIPCVSSAIPVSESSIILDTLSFAITVAPLPPDSIPFEFTFIDPVEGVDTRSSFSSAVVGLNGVVSDEFASDFVEGAFTDTAFAASLSDPTGSVTGSGSTSATSSSAGGQIYLASGPSYADVFIAQSALTGQFTVTAPASIVISANYSYSQYLDSIEGGTALSDILAGIYLSDFDTALPVGTGSDTFPLVNSVTGLGTFSQSGSGFLTIVADLFPGFVYDFVASSSVVASASAPEPAPIPEPATMLLFGIGVFVAAAAGRRSFN